MSGNTSNAVISTTIMPFLVVKNGRRAIEFYTKGLGADQLAIFEKPDGKIMAQLAIAGAEFWIGDEEIEFGNRAPETIGGSPVRIVLTVSDPDTVFDRALKAGAKQICPVTTEEDWKIGKLADPSGHIWEIGYPLKK